MTVILYILFGILSGVMGGMGLGGGVALIPLLTIFLGIGQKVAQGYNLLSFLLVAIISLIIHAKNGLIDFRQGIFVVLAGAAFAVGGALLVTIVDAEVLRWIFAGFVMVLAVWQFVDAVRMPAKKVNKAKE